MPALWSGLHEREIRERSDGEETDGRTCSNASTDLVDMMGWTTPSDHPSGKGYYVPSARTRGGLVCGRLVRAGGFSVNTVSAYTEINEL